MRPLNYSVDPLHSIYLIERKKKYFALKQCLYQGYIKRNWNQINVEKYTEV